MSSHLADLTCSHCHGVLSDPIVLPCGQTICQKHLAETNAVASFNCRSCAQWHQMPPNGLLPDNVIVANMLQSAATIISRVDRECIERRREAKEVCTQLRHRVNDMEKMTKSPSLFVNDYVDEEINKIDIKREVTMTTTFIL